MVIQILVKISHITIVFIVSLASNRITLNLGPQLCITWIWMVPTGVWMLSMDRDHAFPGQHLLQLVTRLGYLTVVSRKPCARVLCVRGQTRGVILLWIDPFSLKDSREVIFGFKLGLHSTMTHIHCMISPRLAKKWSYKFWSKLATSPWIWLYHRPLTGLL